MDSSEIKEKLIKAEQTVEKKKATIERHKKQAEKKLKIIHENGWNENDRYAFLNTPQYHESYCLVCDYQSKLEDIKDATKKLTDAEKIVDNWVEKFKDALKKEGTYETELPEVFKTLRDFYTDSWDQHDKDRREKLKKEYNEKGYDEFIKEHKPYDYDFMEITDEQIHNSNLKNATDWILDLYNRVKNITGEVIDWSGLFTGYKGELNGVVTGKNGTAKVESYLAGGWNIQKFHARVLVTDIK